MAGGVSEASAEASREVNLYTEQAIHVLVRRGTTQLSVERELVETSSGDEVGAAGGKSGGGMLTVKH